MRFVIRPRPEPGECLAGYARRAILANGYAETGEVVGRLIGNPYFFNRSQIGRGPIIAFLDALEVNHKLYPHLVPQAERGGHILYGLDYLERELFNFSHRRICPRCFDESPIHLHAWQYALMQVCPKHDLFLIKQCVCGDPLMWHRYERCICGRRLGLLPAKEAGGRLHTLAQELLDRAIGNSTVHPDLRPMPLQELLRVALVLGQTDYISATLYTGRNWPRAIDLHGADAGMSILRSGYNAFKAKAYSVSGRSYPRGFFDHSGASVRIARSLLRVSQDQKFRSWCHGLIANAPQPLDLDS
ncbi:TniQ family protein [Nitrospirillum sp. BR 11164]|uniref:TniQ family protein n=1 Tax=Nitrospirillum sp. BR 11164 TaxID=3104324 RepID=UPI002AFF73E6|nr:TniQ family protein [Nitrospirillum sp. BR 11164]MEA1648794.1 TniQ family protein [Nitrospirillum sp. BR 11164]